MACGCHDIRSDYDWILQGNLTTREINMKPMVCSMMVCVLLAGCANNQQTAADDKVCEAYDKETASPKTTSVARFGADPKLSDAEAVPVATVLAAPADYNGKYVRVTGVVRSVCEKKGCWMRVAANDAKPGDADVFIK